MLSADANPYADPTLREAWRPGFQAWVRGEPRLYGQVFDDEDTAWAWLEGYTVAEGQEGIEQTGLSS